MSESDDILLPIAALGAGFGEKKKSAEDESSALSRQVEPADKKSNPLLDLFRKVYDLQSVVGR